MGKLERITVTVSEEMAVRLRAAVQEGGYATTSEIVREALRTWTSEQDRRDADKAAIREMLDRARASGTVPAEEVYRKLREQITKIAEENAGDTQA